MKPLGVAAALFLFAPAARAETCLNVRGGLDETWMSAARAAESELAGECGKSMLTLTKKSKHVVVEIVAPDGSRGERFVDRPRELLPTAVGLLASVPDEPPPEPAIELDTPAPAPPPIPLFDPFPEADRPAGPPASKIDAFDRPASLGLTFGTRVGMPNGVLSTDVELRGDVRVDQWVVSLSGRASPSGSDLGGHDALEYSELSVGLLVGRNFRLGGGELSILAGPRLATATLDTETHEKTKRDMTLAIATRYVAPIGDRIRPAVAFETEAAPLRLAGSSEFPAWSTSLRFGIVGFGP